MWNTYIHFLHSFLKCANTLSLQKCKVTNFPQNSMFGFGSSKRYMTFFIIFFDNAFPPADVIVIIIPFTAHCHFQRDLFRISLSLIFPRRSLMQTSAVIALTHINVSLHNPRKHFRNSTRLPCVQFWTCSINTQFLPLALLVHCTL